MPNRIIKVIKRSALTENNNPPSTPPAVARPEKSSRQPISNTINSWVNEWRQHKQEEARSSYRQFFGEATPLPTRL